MLTIQKGTNAFYVGESQENATAIIHFKPSKDGEIIANSTFVDPSLRGQGVAKKLLDRLVDYARENNVKIRPTCSYVVDAFERFDAYDDVKVEKR